MPAMEGPTIEANCDGTFAMLAVDENAHEKYGSGEPHGRHERQTANSGQNISEGAADGHNHRKGCKDSRTILVLHMFGNQSACSAE